MEALYLTVSTPFIRMSRGYINMGNKKAYIEIWSNLNGYCELRILRHKGYGCNANMEKEYGVKGVPGKHTFIIPVEYSKDITRITELLIKIQFYLL